MSADPHEVLENLDDDSECLYLDRPRDPAYLWATDDDQFDYLILEQSRSGTWFPCGQPIDDEKAAYFVGEVQSADDATCEVVPKEQLPEGRHPNDP